MLVFIQKFDSILHGAKPETLIENTHRRIREVLLSPECRELSSDAESTEAARVKACDKVIMKGVEAVDRPHRTSHAEG